MLFDLELEPVVFERTAEDTLEGMLVGKPKYRAGAAERLQAAWRADEFLLILVTQT